MLIHVSEQPDIERFEPQPSQYTEESVVWAIDEARVGNYLVPRDCPRVTYYASRTTSPEDLDRFLGSSRSVVAIESSWWNRVRSCRLYCYDFSEEGFECIDECAGYFVSLRAVVPKQVRLVSDPVAELLRLGIELRVIPDLWSLRDAVVASTLSFSLIRMRNAQPRQTSTVHQLTARSTDTI